MKHYSGISNVFPQFERLLGLDIAEQSYWWFCTEVVWTSEHKRLLCLDTLWCGGLSHDPLLIFIPVTHLHLGLQTTSSSGSSLTEASFRISPVITPSLTRWRSMPTGYLCLEVRQGFMLCCLPFCWSGGASVVPTASQLCCDGAHLTGVCACSQCLDNPCSMLYS